MSVVDASNDPRRWRAPSGRPAGTNCADSSGRGNPRPIARYVAQVAQDGLDLYRFERLLEEGGRALEAADAPRAAALLRDALAAWRGPALADLEFEPFAQPEIARLEELRLGAGAARRQPPARPCGADDPASASATRPSPPCSSA